jgi:glutathione synthase/RimK-type ligase-like ATP-grasp enzyme
MNILFVVSHAHDWPFQIPGVKVVPAQFYLDDPAYRDCAATKVFNLCQSYRYQSRGYYVSMLADARGHRPVPDVKALEDLRSDEMIKMLADTLDESFQPMLAGIDSDSFELHSYFGRTADRRHAQLGEHLFNQLSIPLLKARLERDDHACWHLRGVHALTLDDIAPDDLRSVADAATDCVKRYRTRVREPAAQKPSVAILRSPDCSSFPSNPMAIQKFQEAAEMLGMRPELITRADTERVTQFDGLFIRDTTNVNHYTYRLARQAALAGLIVIDDPDSILKCGNKIFMTELLGRHHLPIPKTMLVHHDNLDQIIPALGLPCILKQPDGCFSVGVEKAESVREMAAKADLLFATSELILAQEYMPTRFDWRVGILDRQPLFVCRYFMAPGHWQIIKHDESRSQEGVTQALAIDDAPDEVIDLAMQAANLIGDGFYGVDIKQRGHQCYVIEINDNPSVDAGNEDGALKDKLYREVMSIFKTRIEARRGCIP